MHAAINPVGNCAVLLSATLWCHKEYWGDDVGEACGFMSRLSEDACGVFFSNGAEHCGGGVWGWWRERRLVSRLQPGSYPVELSAILRPSSPPGGVPYLTTHLVVRHVRQIWAAAV
jgi:hypothetical protein